MGIAAPLSTPGYNDRTRWRSSDSSPSSPTLLSISSTPTFPTPSDSHHHRVIPDPASIFANATTTSLSTTIDTTTNSTATTTTGTSAIDIARRGHSLDLPSSTASVGKQQHHRHAAGAKIRRSISELLNFGSNGARSRRRSLPFAFKGRSSSTRRTAAPVPGTDNGSRSGVGSSALQHSLNLDDASAEGAEEGWEEDTREDEGAS
jgi:hypothetical protein